MKSLLLCLAFLAIASVPALAFDEEHEVWPACQSDDDCVKVYLCADRAVNKQYVDAIKSTYKGCDGAAISNPKTVAKCVDNMCTLVTPDESR